MGIGFSRTFPGTLGRTPGDPPRRPGKSPGRPISIQKNVWGNWQKTKSTKMYGPIHFGGLSFFREKNACADRMRKIGAEHGIVIITVRNSFPADGIMITKCLKLFSS